MVRPNHQQGDGAHARSEADRLRELIEPTVSAHRLYLEDVRVKPAAGTSAVEVIVDLPEEQTGAVTLDTISEVSSEVSAVLDQDPQVSARSYTLEVSSPGAARPLTEPRHWRRATGRMVTVTLEDQDPVTGRLLEVDDEGVTVRPEKAPKKGMKPKRGEPAHLEFERIRKGHVEIEFTHAGDDGDAPAGHFAPEEA
ncbi:ribosome maturation factor RimP [Arthrobacter castelli]|uniref:ribosome maturation factor RimP n=1 Tax=Arthrobacter castelli TaxID=271431 RepID=UPI0004243706|nr:ribosome maturation factor RimP [Arthrobacter castelli]